MWLNDIYHSLNPVAFQIGSLAIRWYGLAYIAAFIIGGILIWRIQQRWKLNLSRDDVLTVVLSVIYGVIIGARLIYVVFYGAGYYLQHPLDIFALNTGGMSFHGGLLGAVIGGSLACRHLHISIMSMCDIGVIVAPVGLFLGRCANFVNGELWGKPSDLPWAVMFDTTGGGAVFRHPSQLYEAVLEGLILFILLFILSRKRPPLPQGTYLGIFLLLYGVFRFLVEFVRLPDAQLGYIIAGTITMGQLLSLPLVLAGIGFLWWAYKTKRPQQGYLLSQVKKR